MRVDFPKTNNKLAFFGYDGTLIVFGHSEGFIKAQKDGYMAACIWALTVLDEESANDKALPCMRWYAGKLSEDGYGVYCLAKARSNLCSLFRQKQLGRLYPNIPIAYLETDTQEHKIDMMKAVALNENCAFCDVIFVDDDKTLVDLALGAGFDAHHISEIAMLYETTKTPHEQNMFIKAKNLPIGDIPGLQEMVEAAEQEVLCMQDPLTESLTKLIPPQEYRLAAK